MHAHKETVRLRWRHLVLGGLVVFWLIVLLALSGCMDVAQWQLRTFYGVDCRPEHLTPDGTCSPVKKASPDTKGGSDVHTAHP